MTTNETLDMHRPTAEFRDFLEGEVVREYRRNRTYRRLRAAAVIFVSIGIGMSATFASAQVRENAQKDSVLAAANSDAMLALMRYGFAKAQYAEEQKQVAAGAHPSSSLTDAETQMLAAEHEMARTILNVREIEATGLPIRDDLNAPRVKGEDFVKYRLERRAMMANRRLQIAERKRDDMKQRVAVGAIQESDAAEAELEVARARGELAVLAERIKARTDFLEKGTRVEDLTRRIERVDTEQAAMVAQLAYKNSQATLALVERGHAAGAVAEVALLRARLAVAERQLELQRLSLRLKQIPRLRPINPDTLNREGSR